MADTLTGHANVAPIDVYREIPSTVTTAVTTGIALDINDAAATTSGYMRGIYIDYANTGAKTSSAEINPLAIDVAVSAAVPYAYIGSFYMSTSGNPTIGLVSALTIYMDNLGTGVTYSHMLDLQTGNPTASAATRETYIRFRNHGTGTPTSVLFLQANNNAAVATYFIEAGTNSETSPVAAASTTNDSTWTYKVKCRYGSTTFYLVGCATA